MSRQLSKKQDAHQDAVWALCFVDNDRFASGSVDGTVKVWRIDTASGEDAVIAKAPELVFSTQFPLGVISIARLHGAKSLAVASMDSTIRILDVATGALVDTIKAGPLDCWTVCSQANDVASGTHAGHVNIWDAASRRLTRTLEGTGSFALSVARHGKLLAVGCRDGSVRLYDLGQDSAAPRLLVGHAMPVRALCFSPDGSVLYTGCDDCSSLCFSTQGGEQIGALTGNASWVFGVAASDRHVATAGADRKVRVFDAATKECTATFEAHATQAFCVAMSPNGRFMLSGGGSGEVQLYSLS